MVINRRRFLQMSGAFAGAALLPGAGRTQERFIAVQGPWRKFDITTALTFTKPKGKAQAWIPVPAVNADDWARALGSDWVTNAKVARLDRDEASGVELVYMQWDENETSATAQISSHAETRDRITEFTRPIKAEPLSEEDRRRYTAAVSFMPHDVWLRETATKITENAKTDLGKAKAIYEWIVEEQSCDVTDLRMLVGGADRSGAFPQSCDYLTSLFVGLARVSGLPAREIYGLRVAPSQFGFESLGAVPADITAKTHSRGEVWLADYGWVPATPGDVRRVIRDEASGNLELTDPKAVSARVTLFGAWEGNWVAYNMANDFALPEGEGAAVPFLIRPRVMTSAGLLGEEQTQDYSFRLAARELPA
jgi:transglutaminase-like putative cysteine protease